MMGYALRVVAIVVLNTLAGCAVATKHDAAHRAAPQSAQPSAARTDVLNRLKDEINNAYGLRDGDPRINLGPCGRFARDFRERWNARFRDPVHIVFVMSYGLARSYPACPNYSDEITARLIDHHLAMLPAER